MRKQIVLSVGAVFALVTGGFAVSLAADPQDSGTTDATKVKTATTLARNQLASELQLEVTSIEALSAEQQTWSDSSLGCGKPGTMAAQVITPGYAVILKTPRGNYRVHVAEKYAVICGPATQFRNLNRPGGRGVGLPLKNLNQQIDLARADLAKKLPAPVKDIETLTFVLTEWPDTAMECVVAGEQIDKKITQGYRIVLQYAGRNYTYHTDLKRVRACPAIEVD
jgi:hypothetical protein